MKKTILLVLLCLALLLTACGGSETEAEETKKKSAVLRPEGWNAEEEFLRFLTGYMEADSVEELRGFVTANTTDEEIENALQEKLALWEELPELRDWKPQGVSNLTLVDTYKGFEVLWAQVADTGEEVGVGLMPTFYFLAIEKDHYAVSLNESLMEIFQKKYTVCFTCAGRGNIGDVLTIAPVMPDGEGGVISIEPGSLPEGVVSVMPGGEGGVISIEPGSLPEGVVPVMPGGEGGVITLEPGSLPEGVETEQEIIVAPGEMIQSETVIIEPGSGLMEQFVCTNCDGKGYIIHP